MFRASDRMSTWGGLRASSSGDVESILLILYVVVFLILQRLTSARLTQLCFFPGSFREEIFATQIILENSSIYYNFVLAIVYTIRTSRATFYVDLAYDLSIKISSNVISSAKANILVEPSPLS